MEFLRPLTDLQVKEKEMARFECEISRENAKVCDYIIAILYCQLYVYFWFSQMGLKKLISPI